MKRPTYRECLEAGMTQAETARARGITAAAVCHWERRNGVSFARAWDDPEFVEAHRERCSKSMKARHADPKFAKAHRERSRKRMKAMTADPNIDMRQKHLRALTKDERADYDAHKRAGASKAEALTAIGRGDLVK